MNPTSHESSGINLPAPIGPESLPLAGGEVPNIVPEAMTFGPSPAGTSKPASTAIPLPIPTASVPNLPGSGVASTTNLTSPSVADDSDLIEKEWVQKAKEIVHHTQNDPHQQSKELNMFKADYMQKRYNKVLKLSE